MKYEYWYIVILQPIWLRYGVSTIIFLCLINLFFIFYILPLRSEFTSYQKNIDNSTITLTNIKNTINSYSTYQSLTQHKQSIITQLEQHNVLPNSILVTTSDLSQKIIASGCQLNKIQPTTKQHQSSLVISHWQISLIANFHQLFQLITQLSQAKEIFIIETLTITSQLPHLNIQMELALYQIDKEI